jgi:type I restriction-modification system DNA methylase subunit
MSEERLDRIIEDFNYRSLNLFFRSKCENYAETPEGLSQYDDERFTDFQKLGEIRFNSGDKLVITSSLVSSDLSERSGKKAQYEKAKKILKEMAVYDAGFFIFHDNTGSFRFSLVYAQFQGTKRSFSNFRRFTYFVSKDQTNKTFRIRVGGCTFLSLEAVKDAFSVEKVNKEFYNHIARFFYRLTGYECKREMTLPSVSDDDEKTYQEFAVRLIGRAIFCWFLKHKKSANGVSLIAESILSSEAVKRNSQYYHSTLEKLFFEVLNTPQEQRHKNILPDADKIPFLNGGLFEPHRDDFYSGEPLYNLVIPDGWFEQFFEILEQYNFTIDENSTVDADVSVDPEMLGRIFENLLAEVDPETGDTARKATGSYYTPRAIVDYMVDESLKQYLITKAKIDEDRIIALLSYEAPEIALSESEKSSIISALDGIKIIDPACGSGAFPMGILHKMLLVLQKVDPDLKLWLKNHLGNIEPGIFKDRLLERIRNENWEYVRKLLIIQKSIYGVDIQTIAVEISKLRFFLSLIVDEQIEDLKKNRGVEPLPNLEFKFVAANSLIELPPVLNRQVGLGVVSEEITRLKELRNRYLRSYGREKKQIEEDFLKTRGKLIEHNNDWGKDALALQLVNWNPFSTEACDWFDPEWMFGEDSFDIVIANPPYGADIDKILDLLRPIYADVIQNYAEIYKMFFKMGLKVLKSSGIETFITSNTFLSQPRYKDLRTFLLKYRIVRILNLGEGVFEECIVPVCLTFISKSSPMPSYLLADVREKSKFTGDLATSHFEEVPLARVHSFKDVNLFLGDSLKKDQIYFDEALEIKDAGIQYHRSGIGLKNKGGNDLYERIYSSDPREFSNSKPVWYGRLINRYYMAEKTDEFFNLDYHNVLKRNESVSFGRESFDKTPRIIWRQTASRFQATIDSQCRWFRNTIQCAYLKSEYIDRLDINYVLGVINSNHIAFLYNRIVQESGRVFPQVKITHVKKLPLVIASTDTQNQISTYVSRILAAKRLQPEADTAKLEQEIDKMVYKLYGAAPEETGVLEGKKGQADADI